MNSTFDYDLGSFDGRQIRRRIHLRHLRHGSSPTTNQWWKGWSYHLRHGFRPSSTLPYGLCLLWAGRSLRSLQDPRRPRRIRSCPRRGQEEIQDPLWWYRETCRSSRRGNQEGWREADRKGASKCFDRKRNDCCQECRRLRLHQVFGFVKQPEPSVHFLIRQDVAGQGQHCSLHALRIH